MTYIISGVQPDFELTRPMPTNKDITLSRFVLDRQFQALSEIGVDLDDVLDANQLSPVDLEKCLLVQFGTELLDGTGIDLSLIHI